MSIYLGNFFPLRDVLQEHHPETLRLFMMSAHYRSILSSSQDNSDQAQAALERLYTALRGVTPDTSTPSEHGGYLARFEAAMNDDFNTPIAFSVLFDVAKALNKAKETDTAEAARLAQVLLNLGAILGCLQSAPDEFLQADSDLDADYIESLIIKRNTARAEKDWAAADAARDELTALGIIIEDSANGTTWRKA
jgi:cysteinyl-tRNA synthetase